MLIRTHEPPESTYRCPTLSTNPRNRNWNDHSFPGPKPRIDPKILLFAETTFSKLGRDIAELFVYNRMRFLFALLWPVDMDEPTWPSNVYLFQICLFFGRYKVEVAGKSLPILTNGDKGKFAVVVFENYTKYLHMDKWNKELLDKYCREYSVGILGFMPSRDETYVGAHLKNSSLFIDTNVKLKVSSF